MSEIWKSVVGFEGLYEVSDLGRVQSLGRFDALGRSWGLRILKDGPAGRGYRKVDLRKGGKYHYKYVHDLVLTAFRGPRPPKHEGAHLDGFLLNNTAGNLAWKTHAENEEDKVHHGTKLAREKHPLARLSEEDIQHIRESKVSAIDLALDFFVTPNHIRAIRRGRYWRP